VHVNCGALATIRANKDGDVDVCGIVTHSDTKVVDGKPNPAQMRQASLMMKAGSGPKKTQAMLAQANFNAGGSGAAIPSMTQLRSERKAVSREAAGSSGGTSFISVRSLCVVLALFVISRAAMSLCVPTKYQRSICLDATRWLMCSSGPLNIRGQKHTSNP